MRPIIMKVYGHLYPVTSSCMYDIEKITASWNLNSCVDFEKDMIRISYEGDYFPCEEVSHVLESYNSEQVQGKLDCINLEEWTLTRYTFCKGQMKVNTATLDKSLEVQSYF